jgi:hypothetical protein
LAYGGYLLGKFSHITNVTYQIRDEIIYSQLKVQSTNIKTGESSSSRYPQISEYDLLDQKIFEEQYLNSLKNISSTNTQITKTDFEAYIQKHRAEIIAKYGGHKIDVDKKYKKYITNIYKYNRKLFSQVYYIMPTGVRSVIYQFGERFVGVAPSIHNTRKVLTKAEYKWLIKSAPIKHIKKITLDTQKLHDGDIPILQTYNR